MAPLFVAMSFSFGLAVYILVLLASCHGTGREIGDVVIRKLGRLLGIFVATVLYFTAIQHLTNLYASEHAAVERFHPAGRRCLHRPCSGWDRCLMGGLVPMYSWSSGHSTDSQRSEPVPSPWPRPW